MSPGHASATVAALGTTCSVLVADPEALGPARLALERELEAIDRTCSRFRADSDLSRVNAAAGEPVAVDGLLVEALLAALDAWRRTGGAVDPTVGRAMRAIGYDRDFAAGLTPPNAPVVCPAPGANAVEVDPGARTVRVAPGTELDLGATAKALAADRAANAASAAAGGAGVLVNLGGDVALAGPAPEGGWHVGIADDHLATEASAVVSVHDGGLATSSTTVRRWGAMHHIVDPRTGTSAPVVWRTVSVAAATCVDANSASTAAIVLGEPALAWLRSTGLPARLVRYDGEVVALGGWPADGVADGVRPAARAGAAGGVAE